MDDSKKFFFTKAIKKLNKANDLLIETGLFNFSDIELKEVVDRISMLQSQKIFWLKKNNYNRYYYDLSDFSLLLFKKVVKVESKFQGEYFKKEMKKIVPDFFE